MLCSGVWHLQFSQDVLKYGLFIHTARMPRLEYAMILCMLENPRFFVGAHILISSSTKSAQSLANIAAVTSCIFKTF